MQIRLFKSRFADAITFVAVFIITKTQFYSKEGKREMVLTAMNTCIKVSRKGCTNQAGSVVHSFMQ